MEKFKKIGLVILFLAFTGGVGYLLFTFFFGGAPPPDDIPPDVIIDPTTGVPSLPTSGDFIPGERGVVPGVGVEEGLVPALPSQIADGGVTLTEVVELSRSISPTLSPTGGVTYYNENDGKFYTLGPDGLPIPISNKSFPSVENVTFSDDTGKAILEFPDDSKVIYNFETETQITLPGHWEEFDFASDGESFAAKSMGLDPENQWLITVDSNGSNARLVEHLGDKADKVTVNISPDSTVLALADTGDPVGFDTQELILIGQNNENFKALRVEGFNMTSTWSPSGDFLLYSTSASADDYKPTLWFVGAKGDSIGQNRTNIGLQTWVEKCTFANEFTVYCAVPDSLPVGIGLQPILASDSNEVGPDTIFRVDLRTGKTEVVGKPDNGALISKVIVSDDESTLFFQDHISNEIRQMRLK